MGRPPNGHRMRAASARVRAAGKASIRATTGPAGTARQATAMNAASTTIRTSGPGDGEGAGPEQPRHVAGRVRPASRPTGGCAGAARPGATRAGRRRGRPAPTSPRGGGRRPGPPRRPGRGSTTVPRRGVTEAVRRSVMVILDGRHRGVAGRSSAGGVVGTGGSGVVMAPVGPQGPGRSGAVAGAGRTAQRRQHPPGRGAPAPDAGRDAHPPQRGTGHGQSGQGGQVLLDPRHPDQVTHLVLGEGPVPTGHHGLERRVPEAEQGAQFGEDRSRQLLVVQGGGPVVAEAPDRGPDQLVPGPGQVRPLAAQVGAPGDQGRPPVDGGGAGHQEARARQRAGGPIPPEGPG